MKIWFYSKNFKSLLAISIFLFLFGIGFITGSLFAYFYTDNFIKNGEKTYAVIVSIETTGRGEDSSTSVYVEYEINGKTYTTGLGTYDSKMKVGQTVPIWYMPDNPKKIIYGQQEFLLFGIFFSIGLASIIGSVILFLFAKSKIINNNVFEPEENSSD